MLCMGTMMAIKRTVTTIKFNRLLPTLCPTASSTPLERSSHGISAVKNGLRLVIYGGEHVARTPITGDQTLWIAEKSSSDGNDWRWVCPSTSGDVQPPARVAHSQAAVNDSVYIYGGRSGVEIGETALDDMWKLDIDADASDGKTSRVAKWTKIAPVGNEAPEARSFHKMISINSDLYMFGGCGAKGRLNDLWKFDTIAQTWTSLGCSQVLRGRGGSNLFPLLSGNGGIKIAVVAGFAGEETNDGHVNYNGTWETEAMGGLGELRKRSVCSFGALPELKKCIIFGGEVDPSHIGHEGAGSFARDVVILDGMTGSVIETIQPKDGQDWPEARGWADATVAGDVFYLFGGLAGDDASPKRLSDLWECRFS